MNVEALAAAETAEANSVLERMDHRSRDKILKAQAEEAEASLFPHPSSGGHSHRRHHHDYRHKRSSGNNGSRSHPRHSGANSLPSAEPSPLKQVRTPFGKAEARGREISAVCSSTPSDGRGG